MTLAFASLPCPDSLFRRFDPRWKLAAVLIFVACLAALRTLPATATGLLATLLLAALARLPVRWYLKRLAPVWLLMALFAISLPFLVRGGEPLVEWGPITLWWPGVRLAALVFCKATAIVTLLLVLLGSAPLHVTLRAAHSLRVPGLLIQLAVLSYRYLFVIADEVSRLRVAVRARGYRNRFSRHSYRTIGHLSGTILVRSADRAERVAQAMRCRGFSGRFHALTTFRTAWADVAGFVALAVVAGSILAWDLARYL